MADMTGTAWRPSWWNDDTHGDAWERVREVMIRDRADTRAELQITDTQLDRELEQTAKAAYAGQISPSDNAAPTAQVVYGDPTQVEVPMSYGFGARIHYGGEHPTWDDDLENKLRLEWELPGPAQHPGWDTVRDDVRRGYEQAIAAATASPPEGATH